MISTPTPSEFCVSFYMGEGCIIGAQSPYPICVRNFHYVCNMKKSHRVITYIDFGIFPAGVAFCCGFTYDEIVNQFKEDKANLWASAINGDRELINRGWCALRRTLQNKKTGEDVHYHYIIIPECFDFKPYSYVKLAHEVLHICQFFLPDVLDRNREIEAEAYLHSHIMKECLKALGANV